MANPNPTPPPEEHRFKPGESGNPKGKPKGTIHLSTIIQELADDMDWSKTTLKNKEELAKTYGKNGFKAMVYVALTKAMTGDTQAMTWLAKYGYGDKLKIDVTDTRKDILARYGLIEGDDAGQTKEA